MYYYVCITNKSKEGSEYMSEKEKKTLETILRAVPKMSEFQKGRLYGIAEAMEEQNKVNVLKEEAKNKNEAVL